MNKSAMNTANIPKFNQKPVVLERNADSLNRIAFFDRRTVIQPAWRCLMGICRSEDLRLRVVEAVAAGSSRRAAAQRFAVSVSSAIRWSARAASEGAPRARKQGRPAGKGPLAIIWIIWLGWLKPHRISPCRNWRHGCRRTGALLRPTHRSPNCSAAPGSHIKKQLMASECARADVAERRGFDQPPAAADAAPTIPTGVH